MTHDSIHERLDSIIHVLDEYARWFSHGLTALFFPETATEKHSTNHIDSFNAWLDPQDEQHNLAREAEQACVETMRKLRAQNGLPNADEFKALNAAYNHFLNVMRQHQRNAALSGADIDPATGLRTQGMAEREFKRELDRVIRDGQLFSAALVRVNINAGHPAGETISDDFLAVTDMIKQSIRSFDDAYMLDNGEIFLLLKQADSTGGVRALKRLKNMLDGASESVRDTVTVLSCVATPGDGDDFKTLIDNMHTRLNEEPESQARILEYIELSPLQKMMRT